MELLGNTGPGCNINYPMPVQGFEAALLLPFIAISLIRDVRHIGVVSLVSNVGGILGFLLLSKRTLSDRQAEREGRERERERERGRKEQDRMNLFLFHCSVRDSNS